MTGTLSLHKMVPQWCLVSLAGPPAVMLNSEPVTCPDQRHDRSHLAGEKNNFSMGALAGVTSGSCISDLAHTSKADLLVPPKRSSLGKDLNLGKDVHLHMQWLLPGSRAFSMSREVAGCGAAASPIESSGRTQRHPHRYALGMCKCMCCDVFGIVSGIAIGVWHTIFVM